MALRTAIKPINWPGSPDGHALSGFIAAPRASFRKLSNVERAVSRNLPQMCWALRHYSDENLAKIDGDNKLRVYAQV